MRIVGGLQRRIQVIAQPLQDRPLANDGWPISFRGGGHNDRCANIGRYAIIDSPILKESRPSDPVRLLRLRIQDRQTLFFCSGVELDIGRHKQELPVCC